MTGSLSRGLVACDDVPALRQVMRDALAAQRPSADDVASALAPYAAAAALDAWESLAREIA